MSHEILDLEIVNDLGFVRQSLECRTKTVRPGRIPRRAPGSKKYTSSSAKVRVNTLFGSIEQSIFGSKMFPFQIASKKTERPGSEEGHELNVSFVSLQTQAQWADAFLIFFPDNLVFQGKSVDQAQTTLE